LARRPVGAALEARVAVAAAAALRDLQALPLPGEVAEELAGVDVVHQRAAGYGDLEILPGAAGLVAPRAGLAALRAVAPGDAEIRQRVDAGRRNEVHAAAVAAVAAVRPAPFDVLLAAKAERAGTAVA